MTLTRSPFSVDPPSRPGPAGASAATPPAAAGAPYVVWHPDAVEVYVTVGTYRRLRAGDWPWTYAPLSLDERYSVVDDPATVAWLDDVTRGVR